MSWVISPTRTITGEVGEEREGGGGGGRYEKDGEKDNDCKRGKRGLLIYPKTCSCTVVQVWLKFS